jgi:hypothetical protein
MGIFDIFKKSQKPYKDQSTNTLYELLFCDNLELYNDKLNNNYPWNILFADTINHHELKKIIEDDQIDSRIKILAYRRLSSNAQNINKKDLQGVIVEIGLDGGLDVLASFRDGTARYINQTGKIIIWETTDEISNDLTNKLFINSYNIINDIGPWNEPRKSYPAKGIARISFLVSGELYFGEGPINVLFSDPLAGPALASAADLMKYILGKSGVV